MAYKLGNLVRETTLTTGVANAGNPYVLEGPVAGHRPVSHVYSDGDTGTFITKDNSTPPTYELYDGVYRSSSNALEPTSVRASSNGGASVNWPSGGTRDIYAVVSQSHLESLLDPGAGVGLLTRTAQDTYTARAVALALAGGASDPLFAGTFLNGVAGNITLTQQWDPLRRSGGTDAQRTVTGLRLDGKDTKIEAGGLPHEIRGSGGVGDVALKLTRAGTQSYTIEAGIGGSLERVLTEADEGSGNGFDADTVDGFEGSRLTIIQVQRSTNSFPSPLEWTSLPGYITRLALVFYNVSLDGTDDLVVQLQTASGWITSGYRSRCHGVNSSFGVSGVSGFGIYLSNASEALDGRIAIEAAGSSKWGASGAFHRTDGNLYVASGGVEALSGAITGVRLASSGTDGFDSLGFVTLLYE